MAVVIEFPKKKELPKLIEAKLENIARNYVETLYMAMSTLTSDDPTDEELLEVHDLVANAYAKGLSNAIDVFEGS